MEHALWVAEWKNVPGRGSSLCGGPDMPALFKYSLPGSEQRGTSQKAILTTSPWQLTALRLSVK